MESNISKELIYSSFLTLYEGIAKSDALLKTEGLLRESGRLREIGLAKEDFVAFSTEFVNDIEKGKQQECKNQIGVVSSVLKWALGEICMPRMRRELEELMSHSEKEIDLNKIPEPVQAVIKFCVAIYHWRVFNKMSPEALAIVLVPRIFPEKDITSTDTASLVTENEIQKE